MIHGGVQVGEEERCRLVLQHFSELAAIGISRIPRNHFNFVIHHQGKRYQCKGVMALRDTLSRLIGNEYHHVLLDLTSLELDLILYLLPLLVEKAPASLYGIYLVPAQYGKHRNRLELLEIRQPRGYVSFLPGISGARDAAHFIILGFDRGRAEYFLECYDWDWAQIHAVAGDPAYVEGGEDKAVAANNAWLNHLPHGNCHKVAANNPYAVRDFFREQLGLHEMLDIVPIGPKPMLLGILLFYLQLPEPERCRVRLLYDFPTPRKGSTSGLVKGYLYNCDELLRHG